MPGARYTSYRTGIWRRVPGDQLLLGISKRMHRRDRSHAYAVEPATHLERDIGSRSYHTSDFELPTPDFRLPTPDFRLPTSDIRLLTSDFRLPTSDIRLPTSDI